MTTIGICLRAASRRILPAALIWVVAVGGVACARKAQAPKVVGEPHEASPAPAEMLTDEIGVQWMPPEGPSLLVRAQFPTALAISQRGELFFAERSGRIWMVDLSKQSGEGTPPVAFITEIPVSTAGERGLLGMALHPDFSNHRFLYAFASPASNREISEVRRLELDGNRVEKDEVILELPAGRGCCHKGGRLVFGPDGKLYVTLGDTQIPSAAAVPNDVRGKILRYEPDGAIPYDGPFGPSSPVWATGLRNPFGITFSEEGEAYATDNGPSGSDGPPCCDEVLRLRAGGNYGWPGSYGARHQEGTPPIWHSGDAVVIPTGIVAVSSQRFGALNGAVAFCTFAERRMFVIDRDGRDWSEGLPRPGRGPDGCALDVVQGPEGRLYFSDTDAVYVWG